MVLIALTSVAIGQDEAVDRNPWLPAVGGELGFDNFFISVAMTTADSSHPESASTFPQRSSPKPDTTFWQRPTGALFKSVILPGWGQYANHKYQKAAIFFGLETFFLFKSVQYFRRTRDDFDTFQETKKRQDFFAYDAARKSRNKYYWFFAGTIFISMWDAYADAHLKPFEETRNNDEFWGLDPSDRPDVSPPPFSLALTIRF